MSTRRCARSLLLISLAAVAWAGLSGSPGQAHMAVKAIEKYGPFLPDGASACGG